MPRRRKTEPLGHPWRQLPAFASPANSVSWAESLRTLTDVVMMPRSAGGSPPGRPPTYVPPSLIAADSGAPTIAVSSTPPTAPAAPVIARTWPSVRSSRPSARRAVSPVSGMVGAMATRVAGQRGADVRSAYEALLATVTPAVRVRVDYELTR